MKELERLKPPRGAVRKRRRIGRGEASGWGKTSGRGAKGQGARAGSKRGKKPGFEGGQMPLQRRLPKRGFTNIFRVSCQIVNLSELERFPDGAVVDREALVSAGLARKRRGPVKLLGDGEVTKKLRVKVARCSRSAREKLERAGGTLEIV